ncbi:hypothetical protein ACFO4E_24535 [Nocardiopsis mangrovi]|uniref:Uncharacterized protein n=1 Tax=Nocardiopsis mangrovi TaxID=1179818 RepID=A0ABV9E1M3_9ACTN
MADDGTPSRRELTRAVGDIIGRLKSTDPEVRAGAAEEAERVRELLNAPVDDE